jgi:hypothetical protein
MAQNVVILEYSMATEPQHSLDLYMADSTCRVVREGVPLLKTVRSGLGYSVQHERMAPRPSNLS